MFLSDVNHIMIFLRIVHDIVDYVTSDDILSHYYNNLAYEGQSFNFELVEIMKIFILLREL